MLVRGRRVPLPALVAAGLLTACGGPAPGGGGGPRDTVPIPPPMPLDVAVDEDEERSATAKVPIGGGSLSVTGADGAVYTLTVPAGALLEDTTITMTPLASVAGAPLAGVPHGVALEPNGLRLYAPATLEVAPPAGAGRHVVGFGTLGGGQQFHLQPLDPGDGVALSLMRFSEHGAFFSEVGPILVSDPAEYMPSDWESGLQQMLAELLQAEREAQLAGLPGDPDFDWKLEAILRTYFREVIQPLLSRIQYDCAFAKENTSKVLGWSRTVAVMGKEDVFAAETQAVMDAVVKGADNCWREATQPCVDPDDQEAFREAVEAARLNQLLGGDPGVYDPFDPDLECQQVWTGTITWTEERVTHVDETTESTCCYGRPTSRHTVIDEVQTTTESWTVTGGTGYDYSALAAFTASVAYERSEELSHEGWSSCRGEIVPVGGVDTLHESGSGSASGPTTIVVSIEEDGSYWVSGNTAGDVATGTLSGETTSLFGPRCEGGYDEDSDTYSYDYEWAIWPATGYGDLDPANPDVLSGTETTVETYDDVVITRTITWELTYVGGR